MGTNANTLSIRLARLPGHVLLTPRPAVRHRRMWEDVGFDRLDHHVLRPTRLQLRGGDTLHVDVQAALLERASKSVRRYALLKREGGIQYEWGIWHSTYMGWRRSYLEPTEKAEIRVSELGPRQESSELDPIVRLGACGLGLAVVDAGLVQDALDEELQETVVAGHVAQRGLSGRSCRGRRTTLCHRLLPLRSATCREAVIVFVCRGRSEEESE